MAGTGGTLGLGIPLVDRATSGAKDFLSFVSSSESEYFDEAKFSEGEIRKALADSSIEKKLEGMKRILAAHSAGRDVCRLFPEVVKNVGIAHLELKKLVYMYLVLHADGNRDLALLSINSFQKDLSHRNQLVRGVALRAVASIRLLEIIPLIMSSLKRAVGDSSPYVRKIVAQSVPKVYSVDQDQFASLRVMLLALLPDIEYCVVGTAITAFSQICLQHAYKYGAVAEKPQQLYSSDCSKFQQQRIIPQEVDVTYLNGNFGAASEFEEANKEQCTASFLMHESLSLLHPHYRYICSCLVNLESWAQVSAVDILLRYCRFFFADPLCTSSVMNQSTNGNASKKPVLGLSEANMKNQNLSDDFSLFLDSLLLLLHSQSPAVVCAASSALYLLAPESYLDKAALSLIRCYNTCSVDYKESLLTIMLPFIETYPELFSKYFGSFLVVTTDSLAVKFLKLEVLQILAAQDELADMIVGELQVYCLWPGNSEFTQKVMRVITKVVLRQDRLADSCFKKLVSLLDYSSTFLVSEVVVAMRTLMQQRNTGKLVSVITHLVSNLQHLKAYTARASVVWIIGEYQHEIMFLAPDVLRMLTKGFADEHDEVKMQILTMALKIWAFHFFNKCCETEKLTIKNSFGEEIRAAGVVGEQKNSSEGNEKNQDGKQYGFDGTKENNLDSVKNGEKNACVTENIDKIDSGKIFARLDLLFVYLCDLSSRDMRCDVRDIGRLYLFMTRIVTDSCSIYDKTVIDKKEMKGTSDDGTNQSKFDHRSDGRNNGNSNACETKSFKAFCLEYLRILSLRHENRAKYLTSISVVSPMAQQLSSHALRDSFTLPCVIANEQNHVSNGDEKGRQANNNIKRLNLKLPLHSLSFLLGEQFPGFLPIPSFTLNVSSDDSIRNPPNREGIGSREIKSIEGGSGFMGKEAIRHMQKKKHNAKEKIAEDLEEFYSADPFDQNSNEQHRNMMTSVDAMHDGIDMRNGDNKDELHSLWENFDIHLSVKGEERKGGMLVLGEDEESDEENGRDNVKNISSSQNKAEDDEEDDWKYVPTS